MENFRCFSHNRLVSINIYVCNIGKRINILYTSMYYLIALRIK